MTTDEKVSILKEFQLFKNIPLPVLAQLGERMHPKIFEHGDVLLEEDVDDDKAFFMYTGAVSIYRTTPDGEIVNIDLLGSPEIVGEMGLIDTKPSAYSALALEETKTLILSQFDFQELIHENSTLAMNVLKLFADRIRDFDIFLEDLLSKNLYERTKLILTQLAEKFPGREITLSQEEIADLLWGTRSRVTEVINQLEDEGFLTSEYRMIKVK